MSKRLYSLACLSPIGETEYRISGVTMCEERITDDGDMLTVPGGTTVIR